MSVKIRRIASGIVIALCFFHTSLAQESLPEELGWTDDPTHACGGYYVEQPFTALSSTHHKDAVEISGNHSLFTWRGTSTFGSVTIRRDGQEMTAKKAFLYRDPVTFKLVSIEMLGDVHLHEPHTLIVGKRGRYDFQTKKKSLLDIDYRTALTSQSLTAFGSANAVSQTEPETYELTDASFSTCSPTHPAWRVKGSHIFLNKNTGRGSISHARILIKDIPVFYFPYINFSIDHQRKSGFLWPTIGGSNTWGPYFLAPFYWNLAPNYDMTITPGILSKRGIQLSDNIRYLTQTSSGKFNISILPNDKNFADLQKRYEGLYGTSTDPTIQAELIRLENTPTTRKGLFWRDKTNLNEHWSSHIDFNYAGDDYYLQDFGSDLNEVTENQLLQEADLNYKSTHWNFLGRVQTYQTLHPIIPSQPAVQNQYRRFPQLLLSMDYPDQRFGLEYFASTELTHFDIRNTPGTSVNLPIGNRMNLQPGMSLPVYWPYFYINPRAQIALSDYQLYQISETGTPGGVRRAIPIFDIASGLAFNGDVHLFQTDYQQTLEPQLYYTYIPYRNQSSIPVFDTTVNTLTYDQLFNYNRFSGIDRIGDANQVGIGLTTRLIDHAAGVEKARLGIGNIIYFANRRVTLCNSESECMDNPTNHSNVQRLSPISGVLDYRLNPIWAFSANSIWNPVSKQLDNATLALHFQPDPLHLANFGYGYARGGDILSGISTTDPSNNLKVTDFSFAWPAIRDISLVGRWSQNWNHRHLQNLVYGLQYDSCCWAVRLIGGRAFKQITNDTPQYNSEFYIQFALKGLGNIGSGNPTGLLNSINGYSAQFGQET